MQSPLGWCSATQQCEILLLPFSLCVSLCASFSLTPATSPPPWPCHIFSFPLFLTSPPHSLPLCPFLSLCLRPLVPCLCNALCWTLLKIYNVGNYRAQSICQKCPLFDDAPILAVALLTLQHSHLADGSVCLWQKMHMSVCWSVRWMMHEDVDNSAAGKRAQLTYCITTHMQSRAANIKWYVASAHVEGSW